MLEQTLKRLGIEKYLSTKYLSAWLILLIDTFISVVTTAIAYLIMSALFSSRTFSPLFGLLICTAAALFSVFAFMAFRTFRAVIRHSTLREIGKLGGAVAIKECFLLLFIVLLPLETPYAALLAMGMLLDFLLTFFSLISLRLLMIVVYDIVKGKSAHRESCKRVLVYGTDDKAIALTIRLQHSPHYKIVGFLIRGRQLNRYMIADLPVYYFENQESIPYLVRRLDLDAVIFATPAAAQEEREGLVQFCTESDVKVLIAPPIDEVIDGKVMKQSIREIRIEDLLGRPEIEISLQEIRDGFRGKTILVTGAAGSIGSELCRQIASFDIERLILFDNAETPVHNIRLELEERFPELKFIPVIGDVRMQQRLDFAFRTYRPQIVFHAAAYKHVPLMEENPCEAILANVVGTRNVADKCLEYGVERMIMISTDKAVNPTNIMGASKRLAEIYVQSLGLAIASGKITGGGTRYITTRFGNVLGSNGSVIPRFREQIAKGGPVTVTHPAITRFFMTIPEACRLVMEAATLSSGNEIFVFDMGESVKIADLARRMIQLAGFRVGEDIEITYTGLRPGEKLYEEVLSNLENTKPTTHEKIRIAQVREYDYEAARAAIEKLEIYSDRVDIPRTVRLMKQVVPEFKSKNSRFEEYDHEAALPADKR